MKDLSREQYLVEKLAGRLKKIHTQPNGIKVDITDGTDLVIWERTPYETYEEWVQRQQEQEGEE